VTDSVTAFVLQIVDHMKKSTEIVLKLKTTTYKQWIALVAVEVQCLCRFI